MTLSMLATISETAVLCLICFAAIIGNASLFLIVYKNQNLRTVTNMYILNLAAADILVSVLSMPVTVVTIISERWVFGHTACVALGYFTILSFIASVMSLGMIAINRYFYIVKWNTYTNTFSKKKALLYGAAVWAVSISLASPPLFGWAEYRFIPGKSYCFVHWPSNVYYMYFMISVCFFGPLSAMAYSYYHILTFTRNARRKIEASRNNITPPRNVAAPEKPKTSDEIQNNNNQEHIEQDCSDTARPQINIQNGNKPDIIELCNNSDFTELNCNETERPNMQGNEPQPGRIMKWYAHRVTSEENIITNTCLLVVALFIVCWAPFAVTMFFYVYYPRPLPRVLDYISLLLGYLNSMCNPILYGVRNSAFRQGFKKLKPDRVRHTAQA